MELKELVAAKIQTLESLNATECFEDDNRASHGRDRREVITAEVELFQVLKVEHVIRQLLQVVSREVQALEITAGVQVAY